MQATMQLVFILNLDILMIRNEEIYPNLAHRIILHCVALASELTIVGYNLGLCPAGHGGAHLELGDTAKHLVSYAGSLVHDYVKQLIF
jgi:hypothetical protein